MRINLDASKREFRRLVDEKFGSEELLAFLLGLREQVDLTPDDAGWVLWNICDWYAVVGDSITQHKYQSEFFDLVRGSFPERAHWVVCDSTQAHTQIRGGFLDFWSECYQFANHNAPNVAENRGARFEAHRANAASYTHFGEIDRAGSALEAMASLLEEDAQWGSEEFASATYKTLLVQFHAATGQIDKVKETADELERELDDWRARMVDARLVRPKERPLFGSWQYFNAGWLPVPALSVATVNAACEFAETGMFPAAERLFRGQWNRGQTLNEYCAALFLLSCWRNRHNRDEIIGLLNESHSLTAEYLIEVAPEMGDAIGKGRADLT
jgi:hypothetical protein